MSFDWTITLGNVLTAAVSGLMVLLAVWKLVANHLDHMEARLRDQIKDLKEDVTDRLMRLENHTMGHGK